MPAMPDIPGYTIKRLIARGGSADIYLAQQHLLGRDVAIKVLKNQSHDFSFTRRFINEGKFIASLNHPHIVTIFDIAVTDGGAQYIAMEYIEGGDLQDSLCQRRYSVEEGLEILKTLATTLKFIHQKGIIHRDIKPANILLRSDGSLVLTDFGIAKLIDEDIRLTKTGTTIGSPAYSSPEQIQGKVLDARTDIYSLGILFLELILGDNPYNTEVYATTSINHLQMDAPKLEGKLRRYQDLLSKMLAKDVDQRFADMQALIDYLEQPPNSLKLLARRYTIQLQSVAKPVLVTATTLLLLLAFFGWKHYQISSQSQALLDIADQRLDRKQRVSPSGDSALYYYNKVIGLNSGNVEALAGKQRLLTFYLQRATRAYGRNRLMKPLQDNAFFYYEQALLVEADNQQALNGIEQLELRYLQLAEKALAKHQLMRPRYNNAFYFYSQAKVINKNSVAADNGFKNLVSRYLALAEKARKAQKILTPKGESAIDYLQRAQTIDPHNLAVQRGIENLAKHYAVLARAAKKQKRIRAMEIYVDRGLTVDPFNTALIQLKTEAARLMLKKQG